MRQVSESRRSQRFPIKMSLRFRVSGEGEWRQGRIVNISASGVFFRCQQSADRGTNVEMNFVLPNSPAKESGLEVACKGEVVRSEPSLTTDDPPSLAVEISDYRLLPFNPSRSNFDSVFGLPKDEE
jgi:hypothetical protein